MKKLKFLNTWSICVLFIFSIISCRNYSNSDIYTLEETRLVFEQKSPINWKTEKDVKFLYSMAVHSDGLVGVGFKESHTSHNNLTSDIDVESAELKEVRKRLVNTIAKEEGKTVKEVVYYEFPQLNSIVFKINSVSSIEKLVRSKEVRHIELKSSSYFSKYNKQLDFHKFNTEYDLYQGLEKK